MGGSEHHILNRSSIGRNKNRDSTTNVRLDCEKHHLLLVGISVVVLESVSSSFSGMLVAFQ